MKQYKYVIVPEIHLKATKKCLLMILSKLIQLVRLKMFLAVKKTPSFFESYDLLYDILVFGYMGPA